MSVEKEMVFFASVVDGVNRAISDAAEKLTGYLLVCPSCRRCWKVSKHDAAMHVRYGWPECCGQTMELTSEMGK